MNLTKETFLNETFSCVFVICKNPELHSLLCCGFAKTVLKSPFPSGTNFYLPIENSNKLRKVKIYEVLEMNEERWYKFNQQQGKGEVCARWQRIEDFEASAILAKNQSSSNWFKENNVTTEKAQRHSGVSFPTVVSHFKGFDEVVDEEIEDYSLQQWLNVTDIADLRNKINFVSGKNVDQVNDRHIIWVNTIPNKIENHNIVLLSPTHSRFSEFKTDIDSLFLRTKSLRVLQGNDLPERLHELITSTAITNPISVWMQ